MITDIILIGPMRVGKTTVGALLADRLSLPQASIDDRGMRYYLDAGLDMNLFHHLRHTQGELASYKYFERFLLPALERHLRENRDCVIDLGAGHTVYWDENNCALVKEVLAPYRNVVLILPSPDADESAAILLERTNRIEWLNTIREQDGVDLNEWFLRHHSNFDLARYTVYTKARSPEQTCDDVLKLLGLK